MNDTMTIEMRGITKLFGETMANDGIDFSVGTGEIHVLLGENGAGKTTLMNILFGHVRPDDGAILVDGEQVEITAPNDAIGHGIGMVHQHFSLVPSFTVAENVMLGVNSVTHLGFSEESIEKAVSERAAELHMPIQPDATVEDLPVDLQQRVEIVKAMYRGARTLILDEPTSLLGPTQIENLLGILSQLRDQGNSIVLVTHKLAEVMEVADKVTVLRRGKLVMSTTRGQFDERTLARAMTGHDRERLPDRSDATGAGLRPLLQISDLAVPATHGHGLAIDGLSLEVHSGEILGIAGVEGNGQRELVDALMGLATPDSGTMLVDGVDVTNADPHDRRTAGMGVIPEDRHRLGLILDMSLAENLAVADIASGRYRRRGMIDWKAVHQNAERLLVDYDVRPADPDATAASLSGGNQQKVVLAREMAREPRVLVADNPSWGLDVGAIDYVHLKLLEMRDRGGAVLLVTLDLEELYKLSDRVVVIYRGEKMLEGPTGQVDDDDLALAMVGRSSS